MMIGRVGARDEREPREALTVGMAGYLHSAHAIAVASVVHWSNDCALGDVRASGVIRVRSARLVTKARSEAPPPLSSGTIERNAKAMRTSRDTAEMQPRCR